MRHARGLLIAALATAPSVGDAQTWRTLDVSRQLHDTTEHRIRVQYAAGRFSLRPTSERVLFTMQLKYDEERMQPIHEYDAATRRAILGVEGNGSRWKAVRGSEQSEMRLGLSTSVPLDLELRLGATEARVDAGGLWLNRLRVETGAADAVLDFSAPNRSRLQRLDVQLGAAGFVITNLGNANVEYISVEGRGQCGPGFRRRHHAGRHGRRQRRAWKVLPAPATGRGRACRGEEAARVLRTSRPLQAGQRVLQQQLGRRKGENAGTRRNGLRRHRDRPGSPLAIAQ